MHLSYTIVMARLLAAAVLGGLIGLEREFRSKPAGLRTQMFICLGSAFFTILSNEMAGGWGGDHTRIAAQIIAGIGFIGAGSILHSGNSITGITTAATLFVAASIGMAVGGGLYVSALFATLLVLIALNLLGSVHKKLHLRTSVRMYEVVGPDLEEVLNSVHQILSTGGCTMQDVQTSRIGHSARVRFAIDASRKDQELILWGMQMSPKLHTVQLFESADHE